MTSAVPPPSLLEERSPVVAASAACPLPRATCFAPRRPTPTIRSSRVINPGLAGDGVKGSSWPCRAMRLASLQRQL